jgi:GDP-D-mannose dehydratase
VKKALIVGISGPRSLFAGFRPSDIQHSYGDTAKALSQLGWQAKTHFSGVVEKLVAATRDQAI